MDRWVPAFGGLIAQESAIEDGPASLRAKTPFYCGHAHTLSTLLCHDVRYGDMIAEYSYWLYRLFHVSILTPEYLQC